MSTFRIEQLEPLPPDENPFLHDRFHMGNSLGSNVMLMYRGSGEDQPADYLIVVHIPTGQRLKITFPEARPDILDGGVMSRLLGGVS